MQYTVTTASGVLKWLGQFTGLQGFVMPFLKLSLYVAHFVM